MPPIPKPKRRMLKVEPTEAAAFDQLIRVLAGIAANLQIIVDTLDAITETDPRGNRSVTVTTK